MIISKSLNLMGEVELGGVKAHIHCTPISSAVFEQYFEPMSLAFAKLHQRGLAGLGPKIAYLMLKKAAEQLGEWELIKDGLLAEIRRLTNVLLPSHGGWEKLPYETAINRKKINDEEQAEIDGVVVFFILSFAIMGKKQVIAILPAIQGWGLQLEYLSYMEYADSLQMLTGADNSTNPVNI